MSIPTMALVEEVFKAVKEEMDEGNKCGKTTSTISQTGRRSLNKSGQKSLPVFRSIPSPPQIPPDVIGWPPNLNMVIAVGGDISKISGSEILQKKERESQLTSNKVKLKSVFWETTEIPVTNTSISGENIGLNKDASSIFSAGANMGLKAKEVFADYEKAFAAKVETGKVHMKIAEMTRNRLSKKDKEQNQEVGLGGILGLSLETSKKRMLLDPSRNQDMCILLAKFGQNEPETVVKAVNEIDEGALDVLTLQRLLALVPRKDEMDSLDAFARANSSVSLSEKSYKQRAERVGDAIATTASKGTVIGNKMKNVKALNEMFAKEENSKQPKGLLNSTEIVEDDGYRSIEISEHVKSKLDKAERFVLAVAGVKHYENRLHALLTRLTLKEEQENISQKLDSIYNCCTEIKTSKRLPYLFNAFLQLGNLVNQGSRSASTTSGFRLRSWPQLSQTKTNMGYNLLDYTITRIHQSTPDVVSDRLFSEFKTIEKARIVNLSQIEMDLKKFMTSSQRLSKLIDLVTRYDNDDKKEDKLRRLNKLLKDLLECKDALSKKFNLAKESYEDIKLYLCGEPDASPAVLFPLLQNFLNDIKIARGRII
jgi:hypothetical protein